MTIDGVLCKKCNFIVYSRALHDFRWCPCENVAIDGGREYVRLAFKSNQFVQVRVHLSVLEQTLFDDWNWSKNKYGIVPCCKADYSIIPKTPEKQQKKSLFRRFCNFFTFKSSINSL
jgi:hypothetical protein